MNLLFIEDKAPAFEPIKKGFEAKGFEISVLKNPNYNKEGFNQEAYLSKLLQNVSSLEPVFIFSLDFIPFISLACGAMNMPYVCWLYDPYNKEMFNSAIANPWNFVFCPDSYRVNQLKRNGVEKVFYLPLAPTIINKKVNIPEAYEYDLTMWMDMTKCEKNPRNSFGTNIRLKDATIGYLDGFFDCVKQDFTHVEYAKLLPDYCIGDLENNLAFSGNMLDFYDSEYLYPHLTYLDSIFYFPNKAVFTGKKIDMIDLGISVNNKFQVNNYNEAMPVKTSDAMINIFIHQRNIPNGISQYAWDIMGNGGFLISNFQKDFEAVGLDFINQFRYSSDVYSNFKKFINEPKLRKESILKAQEIILEKHSYEKRVDEMLSCFD